MLEIERKRYIFKEKEIWFADYPFDTKHCHSVVFYACRNKVNAKGFQCKKFATLIIDLDEDLKIIWKNMNKTCCRDVRRALQNGIKVKLNENYKEFLDIRHSFKKRKKFCG